ncbi:hypothetical protein P8452_35587 [Trifolium repens]|nr:hypothetical protein P8452_35587 [Trifolium repens]
MYAPRISDELRHRVMSMLYVGISLDNILQHHAEDAETSFISFHSTFGLKKLKYPIITSSFAGKDIHKWIVLLSERVRTKDPGWKPSAIFLDDPSFNCYIIREAFQCRILLCTWHIRRNWIKNLFKKCCNFEVQREMFRKLGWILYSTRCGLSAMDVIEEFMQIFVDQCSFIDYFKSHTLAIIDARINGIKSLPVTTPEPHAAMESYHLKLKSTL